MSTAHLEWWASLKHGGMLIAPSRVAEYFPEQPEPLPEWLEFRLRRAIIRFSEGNGDATVALLDTVLEQVLGLGLTSVPGSGQWKKTSDALKQWSRKAITGETIRPRRVWESDYATLPVFWDDAKRVGIGRGRRQVARVIEWMRKGDEKLALLTNGRQWRLLHAGLDHDAFAEWDTDLWFEEGKPSPQLTALRAVLGRESVRPIKADERAPLLAAIEASRKGQAELSSVLGERVRQAVELLIRHYGTALDELDGVDSRHMYIAATRIIMRIVVALFAEARELLPLDNALYHASYGVQGLKESLERIGGGSGSARLRHRVGAWPRLLGLFRLIHGGSPHEALPVLRYGGGLFEPGARDADDPIRRALAEFEDPENAPSDAVVHEILRLITRSKVKVRHGRTARWVDAPVDFSDLSTEYIGILYEGLLDFELRRVPDDGPVIFLNLGDQPALPLARLEGMEEKQIKALLEKFKKPSKARLGEEGTEDEDEEEEQGDDEDAEEEVTGGAADAVTAEAEEEVEGDDAADSRQEARQRAETWAVRAIELGKLVKKPRGRKADAQAAYEAAVHQYAERLVSRVVLPGEWYLVRFGGTRKGSGTFYTRPALAIPTVHRTLRPLAYDPPAGTAPDAAESLPPAAWTPKKPEEILGLKVCDPACGSGSFLVAALRFLTEALAESLQYHGRIAGNGEKSLIKLAEGTNGGERLSEDTLPCRPDADDFDARLRARLKRYVVERCIYGVDLDPLAVELCRLALWVETMDRELPFSFLDHKVKCGNALVGCWFDRFHDYPALAFEREGGDKNHSNFKHFPKGKWTQAIKERRRALKADLGDWVRGQIPHTTPAVDEKPSIVHDRVAEVLRHLHELAPQETEERAVAYRTGVLDDSDLAALRSSFDVWCALWFWPAEVIDLAPNPHMFSAPNGESLAVIDELRREYRFFHWELEFPDVFHQAGAGFDAMVGNPPWETMQPQSLEFFSSVDPLYRTYGRQDARDVQKALFEHSRDLEREWILYTAHFNAFASFVKHSAAPFGDPDGIGKNFPLGRGSADLHKMWRTKRELQRGYADSAHPYRFQGGGKPYTYRLFLEQSYALLRSGGRLGLLVPSGVYTDQGAKDLRALFLNKCSWRWLFGFENREKIFDIDSRFKFCPIIVEKGGETEAVQTAFMRRDLEDWAEAEKHVIPYGREQVTRFSPNTLAILELGNRRDLEILEKIYANSVLLGDQSDDGWKIQYRQGDFNMTSDSHLFPPRPKWEADGYKPDEYSRWLKGKWYKREKGCPASPDAARWELEPGVILSRDGTEWIHEDEIEDTALPLYEGRMIG